MSLIALLLSLLILISAAIEIRAKVTRRQPLVYIFKPLTTLLILTLALLSAEPPSRFYQGAIAAGLLLSTLGDVFLMLPKRLFLWGLGSFLLAHIAYILAFTVGRELLPLPLLILPWIAYGIAVFRLLRPYLQRMTVPVSAYFLIILIMAWTALSAWVRESTPSSLLALLGASSFVISDSAWGWRRFRRQFRAADVVVMVTYYAAQWLLALSVIIH